MYEMESSVKIKKALEITRKDKGYHRILKEVMEKYKKLGKLGGRINLQNLTEEEGLVLAPLDHNFYSERKGVLNVNKFVSYFSERVVKDVVFLDFLREYFKDELLTNKDIKILKGEEKEKYFGEMLSELENSKAHQWLKELLQSKKYGYNFIVKLYEEDENYLKVVLINIKNAIQKLSFNENSLVPLAVFSSEVTRDSHYFDIDRGEGKLLLNSISFFLNIPMSLNIEDINEILYRAGLVRDEMYNNTITFGLRAFIAEKEYLPWRAFLQEKEPIILSIRNISKIEKIKSNSNVVFVFENPTVFIQVLDKTKDLCPSLICTGGQLNLCSLMILDRLCSSGTIIYYSGDFDPEGLQIADKLKIRYKDKLKLWRFEVEDYEKVRGRVSIKEREAKLESIKSTELLVLKEIIKKHKVAGYQELLIHEYVGDIEELIKGTINNKLV